MHGSRKFCQGGPDNVFLAINVFHRGPYDSVDLPQEAIEPKWSQLLLKGGGVCTSISEETYNLLWFSKGDPDLTSLVHTILRT